MNIENITADTASQASHIYAASWKVGYKGIIPQQYLDELSAESWEPQLKYPNNKNFILKDNGKYVATSSVCAARDKNMPDWGEIISLYVLPEHFRKGYGKALLSYDVQQLNNDGFQKIYLWVLEDNFKARSFYEKLGFIPNGDKITLNIGGKDLVEMRYVNQY